MEPYDAEFRGEVLAACDANEGTHDIALRFKVSESWLRRIKQQRRETGQVAPKTAAPRQPKWHAWADWLVAKISCSTRHLSARVASRIEAGTGRRGLPEDDLQCLSSARAIAKKKTLIASEQDRPDVVEQRTAWRASQIANRSRQSRFHRRNLGQNQHDPHLRPFSTRGTRLAEKTPCGRWQTTTFLGALRAEGFIAPLTVEGAINGDPCSAPGSSNIWCPS